MLDSLTRAEIRLQSFIAELADSSGPLVETTRMNDEIRAGMKGLAKGIEGMDRQDLKVLADEQDREQYARLIMQKTERHEQQHKQLQIALRKANLSAKQNMDKAALKEREELLGAGAERRAIRMRKLQYVSFGSFGPEELEIFGATD
ncbi:hypothetical protein HK104_009690 [Borealophlyctis nickersoniae]|nr:hypothetical protein HK104_009690 [Borealophlyctis nickersoniae]